MKLERRLALFTFGFLVLYVPFETWFSWGDGLHDPFYLVDFIGMVLLFWGALHSRRQGYRSPGVLAAAWAWCGANFWRAFFGRVETVRAGEQLTLGTTELCIVGCATAIALICLAALLVLCTRRTTA